MDDSSPEIVRPPQSRMERLKSWIGNFVRHHFRWLPAVRKGETVTSAAPKPPAEGWVTTDYSTITVDGVTTRVPNPGQDPHVGPIARPIFRRDTTP